MQSTTAALPTFHVLPTSSIELSSDAAGFRRSVRLETGVLARWHKNSGESRTIGIEAAADLVISDRHVGDEDRLRAWAAKVVVLRGRAVELSRSANDFGGDPDAQLRVQAEAFMVCAKLDQAVNAYFDLSEKCRGR